MARERYLLHAEEETIHAGKVSPQTPKQKRQNWWFYHKGPLIVCLLVAAVVFSIFYSIFSKVEPDYTVALMTSYTMPQNGQEELERCIAAYANDRNGDGQVLVEVSNYVFSGTIPTTAEAYQQQQAEIARLAVDTGTNESMIFLSDQEAFSYLQEDFGGFFLYNDGSPMPEDAVDFENAWLPWSELAAFAEFTPETQEEDTFDSSALLKLYGKLGVSIRSAEGGSIEKSEKDMAYYQDCAVLYERLKNGEAP